MKHGVARIAFIEPRQLIFAKTPSPHVYPATSLIHPAYGSPVHRKSLNSPEPDKYRNGRSMTRKSRALPVNSQRRASSSPGSRLPMRMYWLVQAVQAVRVRVVSRLRTRRRTRSPRWRQRLPSIVETNCDEPWGRNLTGLICIYITKITLPLHFQAGRRIGYLLLLSRGGVAK